MFGSAIIEVAIGLVLVYLLLSLICSALQESLEALLKIRASQLEQGLRELLQDRDGTQLLQHLYGHPLIYGLFRGDYDPAQVRSNLTTQLPTYIPAANFAVALIDTIVRGPVQQAPGNVPPPSGELSFDSLRAAVINNTSLNPSVQRVLLLALDSSQGDLAKAQASIETWFNNGMERVSGWYKRRMQIILLVLGLIVAVFLNVDSMKVARELYHNDALRTAAVAQAEALTDSGNSPSEDVIGLMVLLDKLKLPIGWQDPNDSLPEEFSAKLAKIADIVRGSFFGWLITAFAISFGAPFWFDLLNKLIVIRSTVKPREKEAQGETKITPSQENKAFRLQGPAESTAPPSVSAPGLAAQDHSAFQRHEWSAGDDPQGGVL